MISEPGSQLLINLLTCLLKKMEFDQLPEPRLDLNLAGWKQGLEPVWRLGSSPRPSRSAGISSGGRKAFPFHTQPSAPLVPVKIREQHG